VVKTRPRAGPTRVPGRPVPARGEGVGGAGVRARPPAWPAVEAVSKWRPEPGGHRPPSHPGAVCLCVQEGQTGRLNLGNEDSRKPCRSFWVLEAWVVGDRRVNLRLEASWTVSAGRAKLVTFPFMEVRGSEASPRPLLKGNLLSLQA
jgi:hypothetical protein